MRIDLGASVTWDSAQASAHEFFAWWLNELSRMVPEKFRGRAAGLFGRHVIDLDGALWRLAREDGTATGINLNPESPDLELRDLVARIDPRVLAERIAVRIPASDVLVRHVRLNAAAASRLKSAVRLQLDRLSPFRADDVAFDCRAPARAQTGEIDVEVAILPMASLRATEERLAAIGFHIGEFRAGWARFAPTKTTLSREERLQLGLAGVALAAAVGAFLLAPALRDSELQSLNDDVAHLRAPAREAALLRDKWERLQGPLAAASAALDAPGYLDVLEKLTAVLPDDAQLSLLTIEGNTIHLEGSARDAQHVADILANTRLFSDVHLHGHARMGAREGFNIFLSLAGTSEPGT